MTLDAVIGAGLLISIFARLLINQVDENVINERLVREIGREIRMLKTRPAENEAENEGRDALTRYAAGCLFILNCGWLGKLTADRVCNAQKGAAQKGQCPARPPGLTRST